MSALDDLAAAPRWRPPHSAPTRRRHRRAITTLLLVTGLLLAVVTDRSSATTATEQPVLRALIPMYVLPPSSDEVYGDWHRACDTSPEGSAMIANVHSGPGEAVDLNYLSAFEYCVLAGQRILGYVPTEWTRRPVSDVFAEIDKWYALYGSRLGGIFVDEVATDPATAPYYRDLYTQIRQRYAHALVVGNAGSAAATNWQLAYPPVADVLVVFEGAESALRDFKSPPWLAEARPEQLAALVYDVPRDDVVLTCAKLREMRLGWAQVTAEALAGNPWDRLPPQAYATRVRNACR